LKLEIVETPLAGVYVLKPRVFEDTRGFFFESFKQDNLESAGIRERFVQDNQSRSLRNVLRGLHFQLQRPQAKLCRVLSGQVFDVAVDIRRGSPSFAQWFGIELTAENKLQLYIPRGFAHGFSVRSESTDFFYKCSDYFDAADDQGVLWNDPEIGIAWDIRTPILSAKDQNRLPLSQLTVEALPVYLP